MYPAAQDATPFFCKLLVGILLNIFFYIFYIKNAKSPNLEPQPQGISYQERERDSVQRCQIKQDFRVANKAETPNLLNV